MKRRVFLFATITLLLISISGCSQNSDKATVSTDGSTSMEKVIGFLSEGYMENNAHVKITYNPTGSAAGIQAVIDGRCDIGLSSRNLKEEEAEKLDSTVVAIDAIAIIVNPENKVSNLTLSEISDIYTGKVTSWAEIGGDNFPIVSIGREASSGTRDAFESVTKTENKCKYTQELTSTGDIIQSVLSNPNTIGYVSLASVKDTVKLVSVDNVFPKVSTVQDGTYKLQRNFMFVTRRGEALSPSTESFFGFVRSEEGKELIILAGAIPTKKQGGGDEEG